MNAAEEQSNDVVMEVSDISTTQPDVIHSATPNIEPAVLDVQSVWTVNPVIVNQPRTSTEVVAQVDSNPVKESEVVDVIVDSTGPCVVWRRANSDDEQSENSE